MSHARHRSRAYRHPHCHSNQSPRDSSALNHALAVTHGERPPHGWTNGAHAHAPDRVELPLTVQVYHPVPHDRDPAPHLAAVAVAAVLVVVPAVGDAAHRAPPYVCVHVRVHNHAQTGAPRQ